MIAVEEENSIAKLSNIFKFYYLLNWNWEIHRAKMGRSIMAKFKFL